MSCRWPHWRHRYRSSGASAVESVACSPSAMPILGVATGIGASGTTLSIAVEWHRRQSSRWRNSGLMREIPQTNQSGNTKMAAPDLLTEIEIGERIGRTGDRLAPAHHVGHE